ncbi:hypothetical protein GLOTRDRAFT_116284 [Gloeophyllum trabeum ATCC 11539]|uniref:Uncharacterized protein n=1 Tax=Gloeophyllum trabeum (strain ATCC 11539 / FP-39264 / Madison 617) TaxID=670483 RepID=S7Q5P2_GLOTA|nr:uncharacterized protein GLOTRDRAFT_116284 [Gloeophyllum trabeum ATCC 11539]EPQ55376.1 hypothetical protein GLOTRDRAFT_116284 [Gloeophyllum trabeum ATCC 11539]
MLIILSARVRWWAQQVRSTSFVESPLFQVVCTLTVIVLLWYAIASATEILGKFVPSNAV